MIEPPPSLQFRSRDLFIGVFAVAVVLAFLAKEPLVVAVATIFCCVSWIGLAMAIWISGSFLVRQVRQAIESRQFRYFLGVRIKWTLLDVLILAWMIVAIAAANFVLENYISGGKFMLILGLLLSPVFAAILLWRLKPATG